MDRHGRRGQPAQYAPSRQARRAASRQSYIQVCGSILVQASAIVELHAGSDGPKVRLRTGQELTVARERVRYLKEHLGLR